MSKFFICKNGLGQESKNFDGHLKRVSSNDSMPNAPPKQCPMPILLNVPTMSRVGPSQAPMRIPTDSSTSAPRAPREPLCTLFNYILNNPGVTADKLLNKQNNTLKIRLEMAAGEVARDFVKTHTRE